MIDRASAGNLRPQPLDVAELAELHSVNQNAPPQKPRALLLPGEEAASLPPPEQQIDPVLAILGGILGPSLCTDNPVWRGDPLPQLRGLQRRLVEHSLTREESERQPAMAAIRVVEKAVQWRLRWQQMKRSEAEQHMDPQESPDAQEKAA